LVNIPTAAQGIVVNNADPERRARVILKVPSVLGETNSNWAIPTQPTPYKPRQGEVVWVFFIDGDINKPLYASSEIVSGDRIIAHTINVDHLSFAPFANYVNDTPPWLDGDTEHDDSAGDIWQDTTGSTAEDTVAVMKVWTVPDRVWTTIQVGSGGVGPGAVGYSQIDQQDAQFPSLIANMVSTAGLLVEGVDPVTYVPNTNRITMDPVNGLVMWERDPDTGVLRPDASVRIPSASGSDIVFEGTILARDISVLNGATFRSANNEISRGAKVVMANGTTTPSQAPDADCIYTELTLALQHDTTWEQYGLTLGHDGNWHTLSAKGNGNSSYWEAFNPSTGASVKNSGLNAAYSYEGGIAYASRDFGAGPVGRYYLLSRRVSDNKWFLEVWDTASLMLKRTDVTGSTSATTKPVLGWNHRNSRPMVVSSLTNNVMIQEWSDDSAGTLTAQPVWFSGLSAYNYDMGFVSRGYHDLSNDRYVFRARGAAGGNENFIVYTATAGGARQSNSEWVRANGNTVAGAWWVASAPDLQEANDPSGRFYSLNGSGTLRRYEGEAMAWSGAVTQQWQAANNFRDENTATTSTHTGCTHQANGLAVGTHQSLLGTRKTFTAVKRSKVRVVAPPFMNYNPTNNPSYEGQDDPNAYGFWLINSGATGATMYRQSVPGPGVFTQVYTTPVFSGTASTALTQNFPAQTPGETSAASGGYRVDANSDGDIGNGLFARSVRTKAPIIGVKRRRSTDISIPDSTSTEFVMNDSVFNTDGYYSSSTYVIPTGLGGLYDMRMKAAWAANSTGRRTIWVNKNATGSGTNIIARSSIAASPAGGTTNILSEMLNLADGDVLRLWAFHTRGAALDITASGEGDSFFSLIRVGPTAV